MRRCLETGVSGRLLWVPALALLLLLGAAQASAATLNVCQTGCTYTQLGPAVAAAKRGETIKIGPGTYDGGVTIDVSVNLVGAGSERTIISGGGPVLTIGTFGASTEPTVSIDGVTITNGVTRSSPESIPFTGKEGVYAAGGGIEIPPNADFSGGANVTVSNSVITGNRVAPMDTVGPTPDQEPFWPVCPTGFCPFAGAFGGGIDSWGTLTSDRSRTASSATTTSALRARAGLSSPPAAPS